MRILLSSHSPGNAISRPTKVDGQSKSDSISAQHDMISHKWPLSTEANILMIDAALCC
jgi:hypothetical protein